MFCDRRLWGKEKWYHTAPEGADMRIPHELLKCVVFLCVKVPVADDKFRMSLAGTAFLVGLEENHDVSFSYLVTAKHILSDLVKKGYKDLYVRLNTRSGTIQHVPILMDWVKFR